MACIDQDAAGTAVLSGQPGLRIECTWTLPAASALPRRRMALFANSWAQCIMTIQH